MVIYAAFSRPFKQQMDKHELGLESVSPEMFLYE